MSNNHFIAQAINKAAKSDSSQLAAYIELGAAICSLIGQPGIDSERAAVRHVMKLQQGDLAAEITTQLAESSLRLAAQLSREADFIENNGATSIKAARAAITARNNEGKPKIEKPKVEVTPEVEETRAAIGKLESHLHAARVRAEKAEGELFEVIAERDRLKAATANIEAIIAERDELARRVEQLQALVSGTTEAEKTAPKKKTTKAPAKPKRPQDVDPNSAAHCRKYLQDWTRSTRFKLAKMNDGFRVTDTETKEDIAYGDTPWEAVRQACAVIPHCEDADTYSEMLPGGMLIINSDTGSAKLIRPGRPDVTAPYARRAYELAMEEM